MPSISTHYDGALECEFDEAEHVYRVREWHDHSGGGEWGAWRITSGVTSCIQYPKPWLAGWAVKIGAEEATAQFMALPGVPLGTPETINRNITEKQWAALARTFKGAHRKKKDRAADLGTQIHAWCEEACEAIILGRDVVLPQDQQMRLAAEQFMGWLESRKVRPKYPEVRVVSRRHDYAGTADLVALIDERLWLVDIKTSGFISPEYWLQTAAYEAAWHEERGYHLRRGILRLPKDGTPIEWVERDPRMDQDDFDAFIHSKQLTKWINFNKEQ